MPPGQQVALITSVSFIFFVTEAACSLYIRFPTAPVERFLDAARTRKFAKFSFTEMYVFQPTSILWSFSIDEVYYI